MADGQNDLREPAHGVLFIKHVLRKLFLEDWMLKLIALVITLGLWYGVSLSNRNVSARFAVPLTFRVSDGAILTTSSVQDVTIRITGDDSKINAIDETGLRALLDLSAVEPGDRLLQLTPETLFVALPPGVKFDDVQPSRIAVHLETAEERDIAVVPETTGQPAQGFEVYSKTANPAKVRVRGPANYLETLASLKAGPVDISGARSDVVARQVSIGITDPKVRVYNSVVDVTIHIGETRAEQRVSVPIAGGRVTAVLFGPRSVLSKIRPGDIRAETASDGSPQLILPEWLHDTVEVRSVKAN